MRAFIAAFALLTVAPSAYAQEASPAEPKAIAQHRVELRPVVGWAFAPNSATGAFVGADVTFRVLPALGVNLDAAWYAPFNGSSGVYPINVDEASVDLDLVVLPWPARASAGTELGAFEPFVLAGPGVISTQPVSVIDPANRHFAPNILVDAVVGIGARVFVTRWFAATIELRDTMYYEKHESPVVPAPAPTTFFGRDPRNPDTWYANQLTLTNALQLRVGASFFGP